MPESSENSQKGCLQPVFNGLSDVPGGSCQLATPKTQHYLCLPLGRPLIFHSIVQELYLTLFPPLTKVWRAAFLPSD